MHRVEESAEFRGEVTFLNTVNLSDDCVADAEVADNAEIGAAKLEHQHRAVYEQESGTTAAAETRVVHIVRGTAGTIQEVNAGNVVACLLDATITVDVTVNGVSVLAAGIELDNSNAAYSLEAGTVSDADLEAGDVVEVAVTVAAGGGTLGQGVYCYVDIYEDAD